MVPSIVHPTLTPPPPPPPPPLHPSSFVLARSLAPRPVTHSSPTLGCGWALARMRQARVARRPPATTRYSGCARPATAWHRPATRALQEESIVRPCPAKEGSTQDKLHTFAAAQISAKKKFVVNKRQEVVRNRVLLRSYTQATFSGHSEYDLRTEKVGRRGALRVPHCA